MLSFQPNKNVNVMSKSAGDNLDVWGCEIGGRFGYVPKDLLKEIKILKRQDELQFEVDTIVEPEVAPSSAEVKVDLPVDQAASGALPVLPPPVELPVATEVPATDTQEHIAQPAAVPVTNAQEHVAQPAVVPVAQPDSQPVTEANVTEPTVAAPTVTEQTVIEHPVKTSETVITPVETNEIAEHDGDNEDNEDLDEDEDEEDEGEDEHDSGVELDDDSVEQNVLSGEQLEREKRDVVDDVKPDVVNDPYQGMTPVHEPPFIKKEAYTVGENYEAPTLEIAASNVDIITSKTSPFTPNTSIPTETLPEEIAVTESTPHEKEQSLPIVGDDVVVQEVVVDPSVASVQNNESVDETKPSVSYSVEVSTQENVTVEQAIPEAVTPAPAVLTPSDTAHAQTSKAPEEIVASVVADQHSTAETVTIAPVTDTVVSDAQPNIVESTTSLPSIDGATELLPSTNADAEQPTTDTTTPIAPATEDVVPSSAEESLPTPNNIVEELNATDDAEPLQETAPIAADVHDHHHTHPVAGGLLPPHVPSIIGLHHHAHEHNAHHHQHDHDHAHGSAEVIEPVLPGHAHSGHSHEQVPPPNIYLNPSLLADRLADKRAEIADPPQQTPPVDHTTNTVDTVEKDSGVGSVTQLGSAGRVDIDESLFREPAAAADVQRPPVEGEDSWIDNSVAAVLNFVNLFNSNGVGDDKQRATDKHEAQTSGKQDQCK